jgi:hypothetical protein
MSERTSRHFAVAIDSQKAHLIAAAKVKRWRVCQLITVAQSWDHFVVLVDELLQPEKFSNKKKAR